MTKAKEVRFKGWAAAKLTEMMEFDGDILCWLATVYKTKGVCKDWERGSSWPPRKVKVTVEFLD